MSIHTVVIEKVDFKKLRKQKRILITMIQSWGEADDKYQRKEAREVEGILFIIDAIQDYGIDTLGLKDSKVFGKKNY
jgi:hypothetical protein